MVNIFMEDINMQYLSNHNKNTKNIDFCINNFIQALESLHFANTTIQRYLSHLNRYRDFCLNHNCKVFLSQENILKYLTTMKNSSSQTIQFARKVLGRFKDFTLTKSFRTKYLEEKKILVSSDFSTVLTSFQKFLSNSPISLNTQNNQIQSIKNFLIFLESSQIYSFTDFDLSHISKYIKNSNYSHSTRYCIASVLKKFFNFTYNQNITSFSGNDVFFKIKRNPNERILSFYSEAEISKLISSIDTSSATGKRNLVQPFTDEIYFALLDYLKNAKPNTNSPNIFVSLKPPHQALTTSALGILTSKYFKLTDIDILNKKHGIHALRHSLANNMLHNKVSLQDISVSLGHTFISTTTMYTNIDINTLKLFSLEVD